MTGSTKVRRSGRKIVAGKCVLAELRQSTSFFDRAVLRMREVDRLVVHRFGRLLPELADAEPYLRVIGRCQDAMKRPSDLKAVLAGWCGRYAPHLIPSFEELFDLVRPAVEGRRWNLSATDAGKLLELTVAERSSLEIKTMNAADVSLAEQQRQVAEKRRADDVERKRQQRRKEGAIDRETYLARASVGRPWKAMGISRSYFYELRKKERTGPAHPTQDIHRTGSAEGARTGPAFTRNFYEVPLGSADAPVHSLEHTPPIQPALADLAGATIEQVAVVGGGVSPPTRSRPHVEGAEDARDVEDASRSGASPTRCAFPGKVFKHPQFGSLTIEEIYPETHEILVRVVTSGMQGRVKIPADYVFYATDPATGRKSAQVAAPRPASSRASMKRVSG